MTCTAARKWASWATNSTATPNSVATRLRAECTGLRDSDDAEGAAEHDDGGDEEDGELHQWCTSRRDRVALSVAVVTVLVVGRRRRATSAGWPASGARTP